MRLESIGIYSLTDSTQKDDLYLERKKGKKKVVVAASSGGVKMFLLGR
jgi:hypothetical protein